MFCECSYPNDFFSLHLPFSSFFSTSSKLCVSNVYNREDMDCQVNSSNNNNDNSKYTTIHWMWIEFSSKQGKKLWRTMMVANFLVVNIVTQLFVMNRRFLCYMIMVAEPWLQLWSHHRFLFCSTAGVDLFHSNILFEV